MIIIALERQYAIYQSIAGEHFSPPDMVVLLKTKAGFSFTIEPPSVNAGRFELKIEEGRIVANLANGRQDDFGNSVEMLPRRDLSDIPACK
jgi:hypothetical protein